MSKLSSMVLAQCMLVMLLTAMASADQTTKICNVKISELAECLPAITGESPPPPTKACCRVMKKADLHCLCNLKSELIKYGIEPATAMALPKKCRLRLPGTCKPKL